MSSIDPPKADKSILQLFQEYKQFCWDKINDCNLNQDNKINVMTKIIQDLLNQNEQFIQLVIEVEESAKCKTKQINDFLVATGQKTIDIGQALTSYELEMKKLTELYIPSIIDYEVLLEKSSSIADFYQKDNTKLRQQNGILFYQIQVLNSELIEYKSMVYNAMNKSPDHLQIQLEGNKMNENEQPESSSIGFIELFINNKLTEQEDSINSMICASILQELIYSIETENGEFDVQKSTSEHLLPINSIRNEWLDLSDLNKQNEFEDNWCNILMDLGNNNLYEPIKHSPYINDRQLFCLFATVLNEIKRKTIEISNVKYEFDHLKKNLFHLHHKFIVRGLKIIDFLLNIAEEYNSQNVENLINEIGDEIKTIVSIDFDIDQEHLPTFSSIQKQSNK